MWLRVAYPQASLYRRTSEGGKAAPAADEGETVVAVKYGVRDVALESRITNVAVMNDSGAPSLPLMVPVDPDFAAAFNVVLRDTSARLTCSLLPCCEAANQCPRSACSLDRRAVNLTLTATQFMQMLPALQIAAAVVKVRGCV